MIITKIERQKHNNSRRSVFLNNKYAFSISEDIFVKYSLFEGEELSEDEQQRIITAETEVHVKRAAMHFRSIRLRSTSEIIEHLKKKGFDEYMIERAIDFLQRNTLLDDREFAHTFCRDRLTLKPVGIRSMKTALQRKGIDGLLIEEVLKTYYSEGKERSLAEREAEKKMKRLHSLPSVTQKQRLFNHLLRKGYDTSLSRSIVNSMVKQ